MKKYKPIENLEFEIFDERADNYFIRQAQNRNKPSAFNGMVEIKKYKVTVNLIKESKETYIERLKEMYKRENNYHNKQSMREYCKRQFGVSLT